MSHGITKTDSMFSVRETPWHGLGVVLQKRPKTVTAALKAASLDWTVKKVPLKLVTGTAVTGWQANVRTDTGDVLGIVTDSYEQIQNREAFELAAGILGDGGLWETAGSLWGGKTVWALLKLPEWIEIGGDRVDQYLLVEFSHDGSRALAVYLTQIRVVCNNTLSAARGRVDAASVYRVRHIGNTSEAIEQARQVMKMSIDYGKQFAQFGGTLARSKMTERQLAKVVEELYPTTDRGLGHVSTRTAKGRKASQDAILNLFLHGETVGNAPGTKWCGVNAILEHYQHDSGGGRVTAQGRFVRAHHDPQGFAARSLDLVLAA